MSKILGALAVVGLVLLATAYWAQTVPIEYPTPVILLGVGTALTLFAGVPWAHMPGWRWTKAAYLGFVGFSVGAGLGAYCGNALAPNQPDRLGTEIALLIGGFWVGGLLFCALGFWWGLRFHRRLGQESPVATRDGRQGQ